jgi:23S rRNA (guanosine2251-2'-O)-methyltransferase
MEKMVYLGAGNNYMKEWIVGRNPVYEVLVANRRAMSQLIIADHANEKGRLAEIVDLAKKKKVDISRVNKNRINKLGDNHQGVAIEVGGYPYTGVVEIITHAKKKSGAPFILILDALQDPQNLGTLLRTAEIVGVDGVILPLRQAATITPSVVSASSGASEHLRVAQANLAQTIQTLKDEEIWVIGLDGGENAQPLNKVNMKGALALVVGNEGKGMRRLVRESCDIVMKLPMEGKIDSLNAAVAGSVSLYFAWQAQGFGE